MTPPHPPTPGCGVGGPALSSNSPVVCATPVPATRLLPELVPPGCSAVGVTSPRSVDARRRLAGRRFFCARRPASHPPACCDGKGQNVPRSPMRFRPASARTRLQVRTSWRLTPSTCKPERHLPTPRHPRMHAATPVDHVEDAISLPWLQQARITQPNWMHLLCAWRRRRIARHPPVPHLAYSQKHSFRIRAAGPVAALPGRACRALRLRRPQ
jgi:hypothetical protein